jgi:hypothetical protein
MSVREEVMARATGLANKASGGLWIASEIARIGK